MPLGATLAAATEGSRAVVLAATLAVVTAALLEVASRVEADMVAGGIKRLEGSKP